MNTEYTFPINGAGTATASAPVLSHLTLINGEKLQDAAPKPDYFQVSDFAEIYAETLDAKPKRKIGGAFLYEDTITYLFSRTNYGKSILAFQLAYAAATGTSIANCEALQNDCPPMKAMVVDMELDNQTIAERHRAAFSHIDPEHSHNLLYMHERTDKQIMLGFDLLDKIEQYALYYGVRLIIIDNISRLIPEALKPETVTLVIAVLNRIRINTGASILVIGHTTKIHPKIAIQPVSYFGSSMIQNFFSEISYLDMTRDGRFFLCHAKTKKQECYSDTVPVFTRGEHPLIGLGFNYEALRPLSDVQLPYELKPDKTPKKRNLNKHIGRISKLLRSEESVADIADMLEVTPRSIYKLMEANPTFFPVRT
jgi:hypothetical protein